MIARSHGVDDAPYVVYSTVDGDVGERRGLRALAYHRRAPVA